MKPQCINREKSNKTKIACGCYVLLDDGLLGVATGEDTGKQLITGPRETEPHAGGGHEGREPRLWLSQVEVEREDPQRVLFQGVSMA